VHPEDLAALGIADGARVRMGNERGEITLAAEAFDGVLRGVVIVESIAPNDQFDGGWGINTLTSAVQGAPYGGAPFHDNHVWIRAAKSSARTGSGRNAMSKSGVTYVNPP